MNLPGLAAHFRSGKHSVACGLPSSNVLIANTLKKVDCKRCRRTKIFRSAKQGVPTKEQLAAEARLKTHLESRGVRIVSRRMNSDGSLCLRVQAL